jgi:hypothetical protein
MRRAFAFALCLVAGVPAPAAEAPPPVKTEIVALMQGLFDALTGGKGEVWERALAADAVIIDEFGRKQSKAEAVKDIRPLPSGFSGKIDVRSPRVRVYGDTATIDFEAYERETVFGQELTVRYINSATLVKQASAWQIVLLHVVTLPTTPPALAVRDLRLEDYPGTYRYGPERAFIVAVEGKKLVYRRKPDAAPIALMPVA